VFTPSYGIFNHSGLTTDQIILALLLLAGMTGSYSAHKLTRAAAITGGLTGAVIYYGAGWIGILMMTLFFILGTLATSWKHSLKEKWGIAEKNKGARNAAQVLANAGVALLLSIMSLIFPQQRELYVLMIAASFSSAAADTLSSELGSVYGKRFYNIRTWEKDQRGLDGVISFEGCCFGVLGSVCIAVLYAIFFGWNQHFAWIIITGTFGNFSDSWMGATLERKGRIRNDAVNFINTLVAALAMAILYFI
jgi:uncharacterized protein (TIGR00297 family)